MYFTFDSLHLVYFFLKLTWMGTSPMTFFKIKDDDKQLLKNVETL